MHTRFAGEGVGESEFRRGDRHCGTLGMYVLCDFPVAHQVLSCGVFKHISSLKKSLVSNLKLSGSQQDFLLSLILSGLDDVNLQSNTHIPHKGGLPYERRRWQDINFLC
jgi:hypothetical protein